MTCLRPLSLLASLLPRCRMRTAAALIAPGRTITPERPDRDEAAERLATRRRSMLAVRAASTGCWSARGF